MAARDAAIPLIMLMSAIALALQRAKRRTETDESCGIRIVMFELASGVMIHAARLLQAATL